MTIVLNMFYTILTHKRLMLAFMNMQGTRNQYHQIQGKKQETFSSVFNVWIVQCSFLFCCKSTEKNQYDQTYNIKTAFCKAFLYK